MPRPFRIAISILAVAMATTIAAGGARSQTSEYAPVARPAAASTTAAQPAASPAAPPAVVPLPPAAPRPPAAQATVRPAAQQPAAQQPAAQQPTPPRSVAHAAPAQGGGATTAPSDSGSGRPYVYLLRGLMNIFSLGMDDLAAKLQRHGIAAGVYEYGQWESLCQDAAARWRAAKTRIVIVGHSLGGDAVIYMANRLGEMGIPVALVVAFDPVHPVPLTGGTTAHFMNLYQSNNGWGAAVPRGSGFHGDLSNVDLRRAGDLSHTTIDKSSRLHQIVISRVLALGAPATPKAAPAIPLLPAPAPAAATAAPQPSSDTLRPVLASPPSRPASQTQ